MFITFLVTNVFVCNLYVAVFVIMYPNVTRMYSYVTRIYSYVIGMYSYVSVGYSYVLVWCFSPDHIRVTVHFNENNFPGVDISLGIILNLKLLKSRG